MGYSLPLLMLVALFATTWSEELEECIVGDWSDWSEMTQMRHCETEPEPVYSFPMEAATWDTGRDVMANSMKVKDVSYRRRWDCCMADSGCPCLYKFTYRESGGFVRCTLGTAGDIPCRNVDQMSFVNIDDLGYTSPLPTDQYREGNDIWGWTDPLTNDEYAIMGLTGGTSFVRITDPSSPVTVAFMYSAKTASIWRDVKVIGHWAYIVAEARDHGMQIFDLRRLRGLNSINYMEPDTWYQGVGNAHNVIANEETNFIYIVGANKGSYQTCDGGLHVVDVTDPLNPVFAGCYATDGYTHDAQCLIYNGPDARYSNQELCFCYNEDSLTIVNVNNKADMYMISKRGYSGSSYTHQGWLTEDQSILLLDDETDETGALPSTQFTKTFIWDVSDLENPVMMTKYEASHRSIDHNQYVKGAYTYQANYESGLRILHIDQANYNLKEVGHFDVFPSGTTNGWYGSWSVYPYYPSGTIVVSSIDFGLFVLRPDYEALDAASADPLVYAERTRTRDILYRSPRGRCPALTDTISEMQSPNC